MDLSGGRDAEQKRYCNVLFVSDAHTCQGIARIAPKHKRRRCKPLRAPLRARQPAETRRRAVASDARCFRHMQITRPTARPPQDRCARHHVTHEGFMLVTSHKLLLVRHGPPRRIDIS